jgi:hypothetical protein
LRQRRRDDPVSGQRCGGDLAILKRLAAKLALRAEGADEVDDDARVS